MANETNTYSGGTDVDVWVNGLELAPYIQSLSDSTTFVSKRARGLGQRANRTAYSGAFDTATGLSGLYWSNDAIKLLRRMLRNRDYGHNQGEAVFIIGERGIKVGGDGVVICAEVDSGSAVTPEGDLADVDFSFSLQAFRADGEFASTHVGAGNDLLDPLNSELQTYSINSSGTDFNAPVVAGNSTSPSALIAVIDSTTGTQATVPETTIAFTQSVLGAAFNNKYFEIRHQVVGGRLEERSTNLLSQGDGLPTLIRDINSFPAFSDGFRVTASVVSNLGRITGIKFTGNKAGSDQSFYFQASNPAPFNSTTPVAGGNNRLDAQFITAPSGSLTYATVGEPFHIDGAEFPFPLVVAQPVDTAVQRFGLRFKLPSGNHVRGIKYALGILRGY